MVATTDSSAVVKAHQDEELAAILRNADLVTPDGAGVVWMAKVLGLPVESRVSGVDLVDRICAAGAQRNWSVYLIGAAPGVADEAAKKLSERHPGIRIAGVTNGYYPAEEESQVVARIAELRPDVLFVGFGIPKQEKWIARYLRQLGVPVAIGVGGSFDVISGRLKRAPRWMQVAGLEWLFRTLQQPKRLPRLLTLPKLMWMTLGETLRRLRQGPGARGRGPENCGAR
jgi:N-acetylglucosaminyldiphosphoundecaprenol N-acetyl-beta-D-mannosaminyltransferase